MHDYLSYNLHYIIISIERFYFFDSVRYAVNARPVQYAFHAYDSSRVRPWTRVHLCSDLLNAFIMCTGCRQIILQPFLLADGRCGRCWIFRGGASAPSLNFDEEESSPSTLHLVEVWRKGGCGGWRKADFKLNA